MASNVSASSLREKAAKITVQRAHAEGHKYVELREDGKERKRFIFFCTLCLSPCYSEYTLFDHLRGNFHREMYAAAKVTLLGPNPWPFNDGVIFFHDSCDHNSHLAVPCPNQDGLLDTDHFSDTVHAKISNAKDHSYDGNNLYVDGGKDDMLVPGVLCNDEITHLELKLIGFGEIGARIIENNEIQKKIKRMWCAWLGKVNSKDESMAPEHDFGIVVFTYNYNLGRRKLVDDSNPLLVGSPCLNLENIQGRKRKKSFSDPEDVSESLSTQYDSSSGEDSLSSSSSTSEWASSDRPKLIPSKSLRQELRQKQRLAAERMCDICQHRMLPGKDVAALLNMKSGRLVCSSRNVNGAFHVFHISCLIQWILLCELEIWTNKLAMPKVTSDCKRRSRAKQRKKQEGNETRPDQNKISSVFCPECQGTGVTVEGDQLEKPMFLLSEIFNYKIKASDARRAWTKSPEILPNCSIGFHFPYQCEEELEEVVLAQKLLRFYRPVEVNYQSSISLI